MVTRKSRAGGVTLSHTKQNHEAHGTREFFQLACCLGIGHAYSRSLWNLWSHGLAKGEGGIIAIGTTGALDRFLWKAHVWAAKMRLLMSMGLGPALVPSSMMASAPWGASVGGAIKAIMWCHRGQV